jgi:DNA-binding transcriptional regulator YiaG
MYRGIAEGSAKGAGMTGAELKTLRQSMGLTKPWCARNVAGVALRTWIYWEDGRDGASPTIPLDVIANMLEVEQLLEKWNKSA